MKKIITIVLAIVCFLLFGLITVCSQMADVWWWGREISFIDTALGILADNGIKGAEGGTALRNVILSLSAPTDKAGRPHRC